MNRGFLGIPPGEQGQLVWTPIKASEFLNSWVNYNAVTHATAAYAKDERTNLLYLRGTIKSGTSGQNAFILPMGFRPTGIVHVAIIANAAIGFIMISTDGTVQVTGSNTLLSLNCCIPLNVVA